MKRFSKISEVADVNPGLDAGILSNESRSVAFLPMAGVSETGVLASQETRVIGEVKKGYTCFKRGDVIIAKITPCMENGKAAYLSTLSTDIGFGSTEFHVLRPRKDLDGRYLFFMIWNPAFRRIAEKNMTGSAGQKRVPSSFLKEFKIPVPPLPEQRRIAAILDKADGVRRKRQQALALTEEFLRSAFLEMFGDPVRNPKGWPVVKLSQLGALDRGRSRHRPRNAPELYGGKYPFVQTGDVANSDGCLSTFSQTYSELGLAQSKMWNAGTLCITIAANIAKTAVLEMDACFPDSIVGFTPNQSCHTEYIQYWMSFVQAIIESNAPESAQKNINLEILSELGVPLPPIEFQDRFVRIVGRLRNFRSQVKRSTSTANDFFNSIVQRAFSGDL